MPRPRIPFGGPVRYRYERLGVYSPTSEVALIYTNWFDHVDPPDSEFAVIWPWMLNWKLGASIH